MIICDQLRPDFLHAYGADFIPTPNIDALAENGAVFENAVTASTVCAPARASIVTGLSVSGHGGWTNNIPMPENTVYFANRLNDAGYMTAAVGCYDHAPLGNSCGYRYVCRTDEGKKNSEYLTYLRKKHPEAVNSFPKQTDDPYHFAYNEEDYYDRWACDRATDFIESYVQHHTVPDTSHLTENGGIPADDAPFFLYCGFFSPHAPNLAPKEMIGRVDPEKIPDIWIGRRDEDLPAVERYRRAFLNPSEALTDPEGMAKQRQALRVIYCEQICEIDDLVGRIVKSLKDNGIYENTTIIFTADHGSMENDYNLVTKGPWPYSQQLFVPLIVSNQPGLKGRCDCLCGPIDVGATALDIAGDEKVFGISRSLIKMADGSEPERESFFSEFCDSCKTVVDKRYTFTYYPFTGVCALYDRISDPRMAVDLGSDPEYAEVRCRMMAEVIDWLVLAKGIRIEAHDMVPPVREGIMKKRPGFLDDFDIAYPLSSQNAVERVRMAGLDQNYNEFCKGHRIMAHYGVYFLSDEEAKDGDYRVIE